MRTVEAILAEQLRAGVTKQELLAGRHGGTIGVASAARALGVAQREAYAEGCKQEYVVAYLREFARLVGSVDIESALHCADASYADDPIGDPVESAQAEADEWKSCS